MYEIAPDRRYSDVLAEILHTTHLNSDQGKDNKSLPCVFFLLYRPCSTVT